MFHDLTETIEQLETRQESMVFLDVPERPACYLLELKAIGGGSRSGRTIAPRRSDRHA